MVVEKALMSRARDQKLEVRNQNDGYFALFGLEVAFDLDEKDLEQAYFKLQRLCHPDRISKLSDVDKLAVTQKSADVNLGHEVLKSPLKRAEYLLFMQGIVVNRDGEGRSPSQEVLMESLERCEALFESKEKDVVQSMIDEALNDKKKCVSGISDAFGEGDWEEMAVQTMKLRYVEKFQEDAKSQLRRL